ncbi:hypothetical protein P280DRAFT_216021 [Massarina eburnea CBS 473.64]|uniref:Uncharacterized protein n=1 Tax=Massarina eburnea CBS 473.64 TaxID=1395130 RepID=A0A6A6S7M8_9PLEO|nr:hypothetical protein P280DRAFT_216021 [Massarina eburnea CBS 473.64]
MTHFVWSYEGNISYICVCVYHKIGLLLSGFVYCCTWATGFVGEEFQINIAFQCLSLLRKSWKLVIITSFQILCWNGSMG